MPSGKPSFSQTQCRKILEQLSEPFEPEEIRWLVATTTDDGSRGLIHAHVRRQAYTARLNAIVGEAGWSVNRTIRTLPGLQRRVSNSLIQTGKVIAGCTLTIRGLGTRTESAEHWADRDNAIAKVDALALKRACAGFSLGAYLYDFGEIWVPLDAKGRPEMVPELPDWALPSSYRSEVQEPRVVPIRSNRQNGPGMLDMKLTQKIESFHALLGEPIYTEILAKAGGSQNARSILTAERQARVADYMERAARGVRRVRSYARNLGNSQLIHEMEGLGLTSAREIPSVETLAQLVRNLDSVARRRAA